MKQFKSKAAHSEKLHQTLIYSKKLFILLAIVVLASAFDEDENRSGRGGRGGRGGRSNGRGGRSHGGYNNYCLVVATGTTTCVGATGQSCSNSANLLVCSFSVLLSNIA